MRCTFEHDVLLLHVKIRYFIYTNTNKSYKMLEFDGSTILRTSVVQFPKKVNVGDIQYQGEKSYFTNSLRDLYMEDTTDNTLLPVLDVTAKIKDDNIEYFSLNKVVGLHRITGERGRVPLATFSMNTLPPITSDITCNTLTTSSLTAGVQCQTLKATAAINCDSVVATTSLKGDTCAVVGMMSCGYLTTTGAGGAITGKSLSASGGSVTGGLFDCQSLTIAGVDSAKVITNTISAQSVTTVKSLLINGADPAQGSLKAGRLDVPHQIGVLNLGSDGTINWNNTVAPQKNLFDQNGLMSYSLLKDTPKDTGGTAATVSSSGVSVAGGGTAGYFASVSGATYASNSSDANQITQAIVTTGVSFAYQTAATMAAGALGSAQATWTPTTQVGNRLGAMVGAGTAGYSTTLPIVGTMTVGAGAAISGSHNMPQFGKGGQGGLRRWALSGMPNVVPASVVADTAYRIAPTTAGVASTGSGLANVFPMFGTGVGSAASI